MSFSALFCVAALLSMPQADSQLTPPVLIQAIPGDSGVYVDIDKREEDANEDVRYCIYAAVQSGGPYKEMDRFWAKLYKGYAGHTNGYVGHLRNATPYYFVVTAERKGEESGYSNEVSATPAANPEAAVPYIEGKWWRICENAPDVTPYNNYPKHNACDFTLWQDDYGKWHCVSCIRSTTYPSQTRLLYHWQSDRITDSDWRDGKGIFCTSGTEGAPDVLGRRLEDGPYTLARGMQAPHCVQDGGRYYFFHNNAGCFCLSSPDGARDTFAMQPRFDGEYRFFEMGRDVGLLDNRAQDGYWYAYYTSNETALEGKPGVDARRAKDLLGPWSEPLACRTRGFFESPFVVFREGLYYIFQPCVVWASANPLDFDNTFLTILADEDGAQRAAIEVVVDSDGQYYVAGYGGPGGGIWVARLNWRQPGGGQ